MAASKGSPAIYLSAADCIRDRVFADRIQHRLKTSGVVARVERGPEHAPARPGLRREIEETLARSAALLTLRSRESRDDRWSAFELDLARRLERPVLVLVYPGIDAPEAVDARTGVFELRGFVDSGPALPPGTDEGRFFHRSEFVEESLARIETFVREATDTAIPAPRTHPADDTGGSD